MLPISTAISVFHISHTLRQWRKNRKTRASLTKNHFLIGSIFVILGVITWGYGYYVIARLENSLNGSVTQEEKWILSGSLQWWKIAQVTVLNPLSVVLICIGVIFIVYWLVQIVLPIKIERIRERATRAH